jgi:hypothetical protein
MTQYQCDDGVLVIGDTASPTMFDATFGIVDGARFPPFRRYFDGHISYALFTAKLIRVLQDARIPPDEANMFTVTGRVRTDETGFGKITCRNCFFTNLTTIPKSESEELVSCDLFFNVINPNADVTFEFLSGAHKEQS